MDKLFMLDNGVLRNVFSAKSPDKEKAFWRCVQQRNYLLTADMQVGTKATPMMLLEVLGISLEKVDPIKTAESDVVKIFAAATKDTAADAINDIAVLYKKTLEAHPELQGSHLRKKFDEMVAFRSAYGRGFLKAMFDENLDNADFADYVVSLIAADRLLAIDLERYAPDDDLRTGVDAGLISAFRESLLGTSNLNSFGRLIDQMYIRANRKKHPNWSPAEGYKVFNDGVDAEIVHFSIYGSWRDKARRPVAVFSNEAIDTWLPRLERFRGALSILHGWEVKRGGEIEVCPGLIFQVDTETGEILDRCIDVGSEIDLAEFGRTKNPLRPRVEG